MGSRRLIELSAWLMGLTLLMLFAGARLSAELSRAQGLDLLPPPPSVSDRQVGTARWSLQRARSHAEAAVRAGIPLGALQIPSVHLEVPVYSGTSELNLNRGAAHIEGTAPLGAGGNIGIASHRDGNFRRLEHLELGAEIILAVGGEHVRYRVVEMRIVAPEDVHVLAPTETPSVTLVTCFPFYFVGNAPERYIVRAEVPDHAEGSIDSNPRFVSQMRTSKRNET